MVEEPTPSCSKASSRGPPLSGKTPYVDFMPQVENGMSLKTPQPGSAMRPPASEGFSSASSPPLRITPALLRTMTDEKAMELLDQERERVKKAERERLLYDLHDKMGHPDILLRPKACQEQKKPYVGDMPEQAEPTAKRVGTSTMGKVPGSEAPKPSGMPAAMTPGGWHLASRPGT